MICYRDGGEGFATSTDGYRKYTRQVMGRRQTGKTKEHSRTEGKRHTVKGMRWNRG